MIDDDVYTYTYVYEIMYTISEHYNKYKYKYEYQYKYILLILSYIAFIYVLIASLEGGSPWDKFTVWSQQYGSIYRFRLFGSNSIYVSDPKLLKIILSTKVTKNG